MEPVNRYIIGSGYYAKPGTEDKCREFLKIWYQNIYKHALPERVVIISVGGSIVHDVPAQWVNLSGNLGHTHDLTNGIKPYEMCGWSAGIVALAMIAYMNETDLIFLEQDCLAFGDWVNLMYRDMGGLGMVFGTSKEFACAQSLFLIKHKFIPKFIRFYMAEGSEQNKGNECELKFRRMEKKTTNMFGTFCFGVDRDRPIPYSDKTWYAQQFTDEEMAELKRRKLI